MVSPLHRPATVGATPHLEDQLCFALYAASLAMTKVYKPLLDPLGLTYPQYLTLLVLWEEDSIGVQALGERLHLESGTLTPLLQRMERAGLLTRERALGDERQVLLCLTVAGHALRDEIGEIPRHLGQATGCDAAGAAKLARQLQQLRQQMSRLAR